MKIPVPFKSNNQLFTETEVKKPKTAILASVADLAKRKRVYDALRVLLSGSLEKLSGPAGEISGREQIYNALPKMPFRSAEYLSMKVQLNMKPESDAVEGIYPCPRNGCGHRIISEKTIHDGIEKDTRDFLSSCKVVYLDEPRLINHVFVTPVQIKNAADNSIVEEVREIEMNDPTLENCIVAQGNVGSDNELRLQYNIYLEAITKVNGKEVDQKWKRSYGELVMEEMDPDDLAEINKKVRHPGLDQSVDKTCPECGCRWTTTIGATGFFG